MNEYDLPASPEAATERFAAFRAQYSRATNKRYDLDLILFTTSLAARGIVAGDLAHDPAAWAAITWEDVVAFQHWLRARNYVTTSHISRLSTIRVYARLALRSGTMSVVTHAMIRTIKPVPKDDAVTS